MTDTATHPSRSLFSPMQMGELTLANRIVLAPLTRCRASEGMVPNALMAEYYAQRASAGLLISEASQIAQQGQGYPHTPGIYSAEQIAGWRLVTSAVHAKGGKMFIQLWHVGRISHPDFQPNGALPVAPSAIKPAGQVATINGMQDFVTPHALTLDEIPGIVALYQQAAENAKAAGFDGVEIHSANGYLLDQFLRDGTNQRTDAYGGSIANRARLLLEVVAAVLKIWPAERIGVRLSPGGAFNDMTDSDPISHFTYVIQALNRCNLGYLHLIEPNDSDIRHGGYPAHSKHFRSSWSGNLMVCGDYDDSKAQSTLANGAADLIAFGRLFIANPDLPKRLRLDAELNTPDVTTFYGGSAKGYTDYPTL